MHTYMHACIHTYTHTHILTDTHTHTHTYIHTYIHTYMHTYTHAYFTYMHIHMHTLHTYIHAYLYTFTFTCPLVWAGAHVCGAAPVTPRAECLCCVQLTGGTAACAVGGGGLPHLLPVRVRQIAEKMNKRLSSRRPFLDLFAARILARPHLRGFVVFVHFTICFVQWGVLSGPHPPRPQSQAPLRRPVF